MKRIIRWFAIDPAWPLLVAFLVLCGAAFAAIKIVEILP